MCLSRGLTSECFIYSGVYIIIFTETVGSKVVQISQKILTDEKPGKQYKKRKRQEVRSSEWHIEDVCAKFHRLNQKDGVDIRRGIYLCRLTSTSLSVCRWLTIPAYRIFGGCKPV